MYFDPELYYTTGRWLSPLLSEVRSSYVLACFVGLRFNVQRYLTRHHESFKVPSAFLTPALLSTPITVAGTSCSVSIRSVEWDHSPGMLYNIMCISNFVSVMQNFPLSAVFDALPPSINQFSHVHIYLWTWVLFQRQAPVIYSALHIQQQTHNSCTFWGFVMNEGKGLHHSNKYSLVMLWTVLQHSTFLWRK